MGGKAPGVDAPWATPGARAVCAALLLIVMSGVSAAGVRLRALDGRDTTLAAQVADDRWTLVMLWTTYCGVCRSQYPIISAFHDAHRGHDASVVGIALDGYDNIDAVRAYVARKPFSFPSVVGEVEIVSGAFEAATGEAFTGTPSYLLFNPARQLVAARSGTLTREALEKFMTKTP